MPRPLRTQPSRLSLALALATFLFALGAGLVHPLAVISHHDAQACHEHTEGHLDPAPLGHDHGHACAFCHLTHTLSQTTPPASETSWQPLVLQVDVVADVVTHRTDEAATAAFSARAPPCV